MFCVAFVLLVDIAESTPGCLITWLMLAAACCRPRHHCSLGLALTAGDVWQASGIESMAPVVEDSTNGRHHRLRMLRQVDLLLRPMLPPVVGW